MKIKIVILGVFFTLVALAAGAYKYQKSQYSSKSISVSGFDYSTLFSNFLAKKDVEPKTHYYVSARHKKSIGHTQLKNATSLADIVPYYPTSWITHYDSVVVHTTSHGSQQKAISKSETLTPRQKELLSSADLFTDVVIYVKHTRTNSITQELETEVMTVKIFVRPDTEAQYPEGIEKLTQYLQENSRAEVEKLDTKMGFLAIVYFTINEDGKPTEIEISESSEYPEADAILLKVIQEMPTWTAAKDANGKKVKQKFEFVCGFGNEDGGC